MVALPGFTKPDKRKGAFGISPLTLLRDKYISDGAKTLYAYLAARGEYDNNTPTRAEIADDLGIRRVLFRSQHADPCRDRG